MLKQKRNPKTECSLEWFECEERRVIYILLPVSDAIVSILKKLLKVTEE